MQLAQFPVGRFTAASATLLLAIAVVSTDTSALDAGTEPVYRIPDSVLVAIADAPKTPRVSVDPRREWLLLMHRPSNPSIEDLAERELGLAGLRIRPSIHAPSRTSPYDGLSLLRIDSAEERSVRDLPPSPRIENVAWSPDGKWIAFTHAAERRTELWIVDVDKGRARRLGDIALNLCASADPKWLHDSRGLVAAIVPNGARPEPAAPAIPAGPIIQQNLGRTAPARTYQDLLTNPHDERLFEHFMAARIVRVGLDGKAHAIGPERLVWDFSPSPDGRYLLVTTLKRPFSYLVTADRFPRSTEVWDWKGKTIRTVADLPLQEEVPIAYGSVPTGPRHIEWRADVPASLTWVEALDGGDARVETDLRDRVYLLDDLNDERPRVLLDLALRLGRVDWSSDSLALVTEQWWKTRATRTWRVRPGAPDRAPERIVDRSWEDRYSDPGRPILAPNRYGRAVLFTLDGGNALLLHGDGASPEGDRPFLDRFDLTTREAERLFRSEAPYYEEIVTVLDDAGGRVLTRRESVDEVPDYFERRLADGSLRQLTFFPHPTPQLRGIRKELITYPRADGVQLSATLYLPPGYEIEDGPLPAILWAYPREFKSADAAGQITDSPYRFDWVGWWSPLLWLTKGYAVLDGPTMPIIGEGTAEPNDTYVPQLVASAEAAIEEIVRRGVADRERIAIGGHSYGAFMAANLLAHSDLFAAGLARTGAYNRTLTPFGFQAEERSLWKAPAVYMEISPFMHADKINEPILIVHGSADDNPGTFPMQSERLYNALKGLGGTARLVMLPLESHSYRARESILHLLWETQEWLDRYVKEGGSAEGSQGAVR